MARNEKLEDNIEDFLGRLGLDADEPSQTEDNLMLHTLESLGALYQVAVQNHATENEDCEAEEAKRRAFASALRYFADRIQQPPSVDVKEPYPQKWLKESFPDSAKSQDSRRWLPIQWSINSTNVESDMLAVEDIELFCNEYKSKVADDPSQVMAVSPMSMAVARPDPSLDVVRSILQIFPNAAKEADKDGAFPFMYAAAWNTGTEVVEFLRQQNPGSVDKADMYGFRALHYAAYVGSTEMVTYLLGLNSKVAKQPNQYGVLPLNACVVNSQGGIDTVRAIHAAYPAAIAIPDNNGLIPLHKAAQFANLDVITFIFDAYPEGIVVADEEGLLPLHYAGIRADKNMDILEYILAATPAGAQTQVASGKAKPGGDKECAIM